MDHGHMVNETQLKYTPTWCRDDVALNSTGTRSAGQLLTLYCNNRVHATQLLNYRVPV